VTLADHGPEDPAGESGHHPGLFGEREDDQRRDHAEGGVMPADHRLDLVDGAGSQVELRLIVQHQLVGVDRPAQLIGAAQPVSIVDGRLIHGERLRSELRAVHRTIRASHQRDAVIPVVRRDRDADAHPDPGADRVDGERALEGGTQTCRERAGPNGAGVGQDHRELITADPRQQIGVPQRTPQSRADSLEDVIAGSVSERVVDLLEAIEVDEQERQLGAVLGHVAENALSVSNSRRRFGRPVR
jgi:hypothetical protein